MIGGSAVRAANGLIEGVEAMLNGVVARSTSSVAGINWALSALPEWALVEGGVELKALDALD